MKKKEAGWIFIPHPLYPPLLSRRSAGEGELLFTGILPLGPPPLEKEGEAQLYTGCHTTGRRGIRIKSPFTKGGDGVVYLRVYYVDAAREAWVGIDKQMGGGIGKP